MNLRQQCLFYSFPPRKQTDTHSWNKKVINDKLQNKLTFLFASAPFVVNILLLLEMYQLNVIDRKKISEVQQTNGILSINYCKHDP